MILVTCKNVLPNICNGVDLVLPKIVHITINQFIDKDLWDEARVLTGNNYFINGLEAPKLNIKPTLSTELGEDQLTIYLKK